MATRILLVDDEYQILFTLKALFEIHGYEVFICLYAEEALRVLSNEDNHFDLLILDYMLPDLRGDELALKLSSNYPNLPIIFLSAFRIPEDIRKLADATLTKPEAPDVLLETVREIITREPAVPKVIGKARRLPSSRTSQLET